MAKFTKQIGWQKYEDYLEKQLSSPILTTIIHNAALNHLELVQDDDDDDADNDDGEYYDEDQANNLKSNPFMPLTPQLIEDISMLSSFDCWIGHANFDLTHTTKDVLNKVPGVELLKICSRYRFFIGIGRMFEFTQVRNDIEDALLERN